MSRSYLRNHSIHKTAVGSYTPPFSVTVPCAAEEGKNSSYPEARIWEAGEERVIREGRREKEKRRQLSGT